MLKGQIKVLQVKKNANGFAYVLLLVLIAVIGISASSALVLGAQMSRRDAEQALLSVGGEFERALYSYSGTSLSTSPLPPNSAASQATGPRTLEELLKDPRTPGIRRHLRQIYLDPLTGSADWGLIKDPAGFILGVYSNSPGKPIKQANFQATQIGFEGSSNYVTWVFGLPSARGRVSELARQSLANK